MTPLTYTATTKQAAAIQRGPIVILAEMKQPPEGWLFEKIVGGDEAWFIITYPSGKMHTMWFPLPYPRGSTVEIQERLPYMPDSEGAEDDDIITVCTATVTDSRVCKAQDLTEEDCDAIFAPGANPSAVAQRQWDRNEYVNVVTLERSE